MMSHHLDKLINAAGIRVDAQGDEDVLGPVDVLDAVGGREDPLPADQRAPAGPAEPGVVEEHLKQGK